MRPRIIFDRSAFGQKFELLAKSPLIRLVNGNRLFISHASVFIEETLQMVDMPEKRQELLTQMRFIFKICNKGWFRDPASIGNDELEPAKNFSILINKVDRKLAEKNMLNLVISGNPESLARTAPGRAINRQKQEKWLEVAKQKRKAIIQGRKEFPALKGLTPTFQEYSEIDYDGQPSFLRFGEDFIRTVITSDPERIAAWKKNPLGFPYITSLSQGTLYADYHAMFVNEKPDKNAGRDLELLCHLNHADIVVSNDTSFMKSAFEALWEPKGKQFYTTEQFVSYLQTLN